METYVTCVGKIQRPVQFPQGDIAIRSSVQFSQAAIWRSVVLLNLRLVSLAQTGYF